MSEAKKVSMERESVGERKRKREREREREKRRREYLKNHRQDEGGV